MKRTPPIGVWLAERISKTLAWRINILRGREPYIMCFPQVFHNEARDYKAGISKRGLFHVIICNVDGILYTYYTFFLSTSASMSEATPTRTPRKFCGTPISEGVSFGAEAERYETRGRKGGVCRVRIKEAVLAPGTQKPTLSSHMMEYQFFLFSFKSKFFWFLIFHDASR